MPSDVRIQLEGRLEKVERAAQTWEKVAHSLRGETWRGGALFPVLDAIAAEVEATVQELQRKAGAAPEVQKVLARLTQAQATVRDRAIERLRGVGATPVEGDTPALLAQLSAECAVDVVHRERLGWQWGQPLMMAGVFTLMGLISMTEGARIWPIVLIPGAAIPIALWLRSTRVVVTTRTLILGRTAVPLADIVRVRARVAEFPSRSGKQCELEVYRRSRPVLRISSSGRPAALIEALERRGVKCEVDDQWRFFW